jgi:hypothetical protein
MRRATSNARLLKLAAFLEKLPRKRFDYGKWARWDSTDAADLSGAPSCGTAACALGWATTMPAFRRLGLYMNSPGNIWAIPAVRGTKRYGIDAARRIFGISGSDAMRLFVAGEFNGLSVDATAKQVAKHIRKFVAERKS